MMNGAVSRFMNVRGLMAIGMVLLICVVPAWASDSGELGRLGFTAQDMKVDCDTLGKGVPIRILFPDAYRYDDEQYTALDAVDGRTDEQLAAAVAAFVNQRDDVLPVLIVRMPLAVMAPADAKTGSVEAGLVRFLERTVVPYVEKNYRVGGFRILAGNKVDSTTALMLASNHPELVQSVISETPGQTLLDDTQVQQIATSFCSNKSHRKTISVATVKGAPDLAAFGRIAAALKSEPDSRVRFMVQNADIPADQKEAGVLLYKGLVSIYADWYVQDKVASIGLKGIQQHYATLSDRVGVAIPVPQELVNRLARANLDQSEYVKLLETLKYNVATHPASAKAHAALGQGWEVNNRVRMSVIHYKKAVAVAKKVGHPSQTLYRQLLDDANHRLITGDISNKRLIQKSSSNKLIFGQQTYAVF